MIESFKTEQGIDDVLPFLLATVDREANGGEWYLYASQSGNDGFPGWNPDTVIYHDLHDIAANGLAISPNEGVRRIENIIGVVNRTPGDIAGVFGVSDGKYRYAKREVELFKSFVMEYIQPLLYAHNPTKGINYNALSRTRQRTRMSHSMAALKRRGFDFSIYQGTRGGR